MRVTMSGCWLVLVLASVVSGGERGAKDGEWLEGMRVGPLKRLDIGVTRAGRLIPALLTDEDLDLRTTKTRVLLVNLGVSRASLESVGTLLKWFYLSKEAAGYRKRFLLSAVPMTNPDDWAVGPNGRDLSSKAPGPSFPPTGTAYSDPKTSEAHYLWRFIGMSAPDLVIEMGDGNRSAIGVPRSDLLQLRPLVELGRRLGATGGLASSLPGQSPSGTGPIPAVLLEGLSRQLPDRLVEIFQSGFAGPSPARIELQKRLDRTPLQIARQLARRYGRHLKSVAYIPALALVGRIRLGELTDDPGHLADVERIVSRYVSGRVPTVPPGRVSGSNHSGHLVFSELARVTGKAVYRRMARNAADLGFDSRGELRAAMPGHLEMSDSVFMACPILVEVGALSGEDRYRQMALRHMRFMLSTNLRPDGLHAHSPQDKTAWGRGNGFPALGLSWCLSHLRESAAERKPMLAAHREHLRALIPHQDPTGMWHQVIDHSGSYREFTCTCMITYAMIRGIRGGWLDARRFGPVVSRSWPAIQSRIAVDASLVDVCTGTGKQASLRAYLERTAILGPDERGGAMALLVTTEMARWQRDRLRQRERERAGR